MELTPEQQKAIEQQKENCPFCMMVSGKIEAQKVYEDDLLLAVLDINPAKPGHLLVIPKEHYPILPLVPPDTFEHLFTRIGEIAAHLRKALVAKHASVFVANGPAAGQQSQHFLVHVIPSDKPLGNFNLSSKEHDAQRLSEIAGMLRHNLPLMLKERAQAFPLEEQVANAQADTRREETSSLAALIEENPEFKRLLMENPDAVLAGLDDNPSLKPLFEGVDIHVLSERLRKMEAERAAMESAEPAPLAPQGPAQPTDATHTPEPPTPQQDVSPTGAAEDAPPRATDLSDAQLVQFIEERERLRHYLVDELDSLKAALPEQPRLARFFEGTSPEEVRARYFRNVGLLGGEE